MQGNPTPSAAAISLDHLLLGRAVRELRAHRALTQEELGFRARLHRNYVGAIERGEINPTFHTLLRLAAGLEISLLVLVRRYERHRAGTGR